MKRGGFLWYIFTYSIKFSAFFESTLRIREILRFLTMFGMTMLTASEWWVAALPPPTTFKDKNLSF
jgi:hypothetical protein